MASETQQERDEETARRLKAAEIAVLALLLLRLKEALKQARRRPLFVIPGSISDDLGAAIFTGRRSARVAGLSRLRDEAASLDVRLPSRTAELSALTAAPDLVRARAVAASYAEQWRKAAEKARNRAIAAGEEPDDLVAQATKATEHALERTAITEAATAFNDERELVLAQVEDDGLRKRWDARLEACPYCADANGTIVRLNEEFPQGRPGFVHPRCRCFESIIRIH